MYRIVCHHPSGFKIICGYSSADLAVKAFAAAGDRARVTCNALVEMFEGDKKIGEVRGPEPYPEWDLAAVLDNLPVEEEDEPDPALVEECHILWPPGEAADQGI